MEKRQTAFSKNRYAVQKRIILICVFSVYLATVLWYTVGRRKTGYYSTEFDLFWSYKRWLSGEQGYGRAILANIVMFVPFGFLLSAIGKGSRKKTVLLVFLFSLAFSGLIETLQFTLLRGCFEYDDIINNVAGALLGAAGFLLLACFLPEKPMKILLLGSVAGIMIFCLCFVKFTGNEANGSLMPLSQGLCFQVDGTAVMDGRVKMTGFCFWYEKGPQDFTVVLRSTETGNCYPMRTTCRVPRPEVSAYFKRDDIQAGFEASCEALQADGEYEILLDFGLLRSVSTGVYLTAAQGEHDAGTKRVNIHYCAEAEFIPLASEGTDLEEIVAGGFLSVYRHDQHIYVYWHDNKLYWIAEEGFHFEEDGSTHLELYLWTKEKDKLSERSIALGRDYDLIGVYFEKNELTGHFGPYRVCSMDIPTAYPITSIKTGFYSNGWVWQESFWPVFDFSRGAMNMERF